MLASSLDHSSPPRTAVSSTGSPVIGRIPLGGGGGSGYARYVTPSPSATYEASSRLGRGMNTTVSSPRKEVISSLSLVSSSMPLTIFPPDTTKKSTNSLDDAISTNKAMAAATQKSEASVSQTQHAHLSSPSSPQARATIPSDNNPNNYREGVAGSSASPAVFTNIFPRAVASSMSRTSTQANAAAETHSREGAREKEEDSGNEVQRRTLLRQQDLIDSALRQFTNDSKKVCGGRSASPAAPSAALRTRSPTGDRGNRGGHHCYAAPTTSHIIRTNIAHTSYHGPIGRDGSPAPTALAVVRAGAKSPTRGGAQQNVSTSPRRVASSPSLLSRNGSTERLRVGVGVGKGATTTSPMGSARDIRERQYAAVRARSPGGLRRPSPSSLSVAAASPSASASSVQASVLWNPSGKAVDKPNTTIRAVNAALLRATSASSVSPISTNMGGIAGGISGSRRTSPLSSPARRAFSPMPATTTVSYSLVRTNTDQSSLATERRRSPSVRDTRGGGRGGTDSPTPMSYLLHPSFSPVVGGGSANAVVANTNCASFLGVSGQSFPSTSAEGRLISLIKNFNQTCLVKWHRQVKEIAGKANRCAYLTSTDATFLENILARNIAFMRNLEGIITDVATSGTATTISTSATSGEANRTSPKGRVPSPTGRMSRTSSPSPAATIRRGTANTLPASPASSFFFHHKVSSASFSQQSSVPDNNSFAQTTTTMATAGRSGGAENKGSSSSIHPGVLRFSYEAFNRSTRLNNAINLLLVGSTSQVRIHLQAQHHQNAMMSECEAEGVQGGDYNGSREGVGDVPPRLNRRSTAAALQQPFSSYDSLFSNAVHHGALPDPQSPYSSQIVVPASVIANGMRAANKEQRRATTREENSCDGISRGLGSGFGGGLLAESLLMSLDNDGLTGAYIPTTESEERSYEQEGGDGGEGEATNVREGNARHKDAEVADNWGSEASTPQQLTPPKVVQMVGSSPLKASSSSASQAFRDFVGKSFIRDAVESVVLVSNYRTEVSEETSADVTEVKVVNNASNNNNDNNASKAQQRVVPQVSPHAAAVSDGIARGGGGGGGGGGGADGLTPPRASANSNTTTVRRTSVGGVVSNNASFASTSAASISFSAASFARNMSNNNNSSFAVTVGGGVDNHTTAANLLTLRSSSVEVGRGAARETVSPKTALWIAEGPTVFAMGAGTGGGRVVTKTETEAYASAVIVGDGGGVGGGGGGSGEAPEIFGREVVDGGGGGGPSPSLVLEPSTHRLHDDPRYNTLHLQEQQSSDSSGVEAGDAILYSPSHSPPSSVNLAKTAAFVSLTTVSSTVSNVGIGTIGLGGDRGKNNARAVASPHTPRLFSSCSSLPAAAHDTEEEGMVAKSNMTTPTKNNGTSSAAGNVTTTTVVSRSADAVSPTSPSQGQATASTSSPPSPTPVECKEEVDGSNSSGTMSAYPPRAVTIGKGDDGVRRGNPSSIPYITTSPEKNSIRMAIGEAANGGRSPCAFSSSSSTAELVHIVDEVVRPISHTAIAKQSQSDRSLEALLSKRRTTSNSYQPHQHQQHAPHRRRTAAPSFEPMTAGGGAEEKVVVFLGSAAVGAAMPPIVLRKGDMRGEGNQNAADATNQEWHEGPYVAVACAAVAGAAATGVKADGGDMGGIGRLAWAGEGQRQQALLNPLSLQLLSSSNSNSTPLTATQSAVSYDNESAAAVIGRGGDTVEQHLYHPQQRPRAQSPTLSKSSETGSTSAVSAVVRKKSLPHYLQPLLSGGRADSPLRQNGAAFRQSTPTRSTTASGSPMRQSATPTRGGRGGGAGVRAGRSFSPNNYLAHAQVHSGHSHMQRANPESFLSGYKVGREQSGERKQASSSGSQQKQQPFESSSSFRASDRLVVSQRQRSGLESLSGPMLDDSGGGAAADGSTVHSTHRSMSAAGDDVEMMSPIPTRPSNSPQRPKGAAVTNNGGGNVIFSVAVAAAEKRARERRIYLLELIEVLGMKLRGELRQGGGATWGSESDPRDRARGANPAPREAAATGTTALSSSELETAHKAFLEVYGGSEGTKHFYRWIASKGGRLE